MVGTSKTKAQRLLLLIHFSKATLFDDHDCLNSKPGESCSCPLCARAVVDFRDYYAAIKILRTSFVGYYKALDLQRYPKSQDLVQHCTFVGNKIAFSGILSSEYRLQTATVHDSYFCRNGIAQVSGGAQGNVYVENAVAYQAETPSIDLLLYRNAIGFWNLHDLNKNYFPHNNYESGITDTVTDLTFLENDISSLQNVLSPRLKLSSNSYPSLTDQRYRVNFIGSALYHIFYSGAATVDLRSRPVYWSSIHNHNKRANSEAEVRLRINDGFHSQGDAGPGVVLINISASPMVPYHHPTYPSQNYIPPLLADWMKKKQLSDNRILNSIPPFPSTKYLGLRLDFASMNFSSWWKTEAFPKQRTAGTDRDAKESEQAIVSLSNAPSGLSDDPSGFPLDTLTCTR
ncbi:hypothetical protein ACA910_010018 [Epithemia clementina (nom. ined.)]